jgi:hypothetical protein
MVIAEAEKRHLETVFIEAGTERQSEHAAVEAFGAIAVRHPYHDMAQRLDLHLSRLFR